MSSTRSEEKESAGGRIAARGAFSGVEDKDVVGVVHSVLVPSCSSSKPTQVPSLWSSTCSSNDIGVNQNGTSVRTRFGQTSHVGLSPRPEVASTGLVPGCAISQCKTVLTEDERKQIAELAALVSGGVSGSREECWPNEYTSGDETEWERECTKDDAEWRREVALKASQLRACALAWVMRRPFAYCQQAGGRWDTQGEGFDGKCLPLAFERGSKTYSGLEIRDFIKWLLKVSPTCCVKSSSIEGLDPRPVSVVSFLDTFIGEKCPLCGQRVSRQLGGSVESVNKRLVCHVLSGWLFEMEKGRSDSTNWMKLSLPDVEIDLYGGGALRSVGHFMLAWRTLGSGSSSDMAAYCGVRTLFPEFAPIQAILFTLGESLKTSIQSEVLSMCPGLRMRSDSPELMPSLETRLERSGSPLCVRNGEIVCKEKGLAPDFVREAKEDVVREVASVVAEERIKQVVTSATLRSFQERAAMWMVRLESAIQERKLELERVNAMKSSDFTPRLPHAAVRKIGERAFQAEKDQRLKNLRQNIQRMERHREELSVLIDLCQGLTTPVGRRVGSVDWCWLDGIDGEISNLVALSVVIERMRTIRKRLLRGECAEGDAEMDRVRKNWKHTGVFNAVNRRDFDEVDLAIRAEMNREGGRAPTARVSSSTTVDTGAGVVNRFASETVAEAKIEDIRKVNRNDITARASFMIDKVGRFPGRLRYLLVAWSENVPMLKAAKKVILERSDMARASLIGLIDGLISVSGQQLDETHEEHVREMRRIRESLLRLRSGDGLTVLRKGWILPEAVRAYGRDSMSSIFYTTFSAVCRQSTSALEASARSWNSYMHAIDGNIDAEFAGPMVGGSNNWSVLGGSLVERDNRPAIARKKDGLWPEVSFVRAMGLNDLDVIRVGPGPDHRFCEVNLCEDRAFVIEAEWSKEANNKRSFLGADAAAAQMSRLARSAVDRMMLVTLIPAFEIPRLYSGTIANYSLLRLLLLEQGENRGMLLLQYGVQPHSDYLPSRKVRLMREKFRVWVYEMNVFQYVKSVLQGMVQWVDEQNADHTYVIDEHCLSHVPGTQTEGNVDAEIIRLVQAVWNHELVDIVVSYLSEHGVEAIGEVLPRTRKWVLHEGEDHHLVQHVPEYHYLRVVYDRPVDWTVKGRMIEAVRADLNIEDLINTQAQKILTSSDELNRTPVFAQLDLFGLVLSSTSTDGSGVQCGLFKSEDVEYMGHRLQWHITPHMGLHLNALRSMGFLRVIDYPSQRGMNKFYSQGDYVNTSGFYDQMLNRCAAFEEVWDLYQCSLNVDNDDVIHLGSLAEYNVSMVGGSKIGFALQFGGYPLGALVKKRNGTVLTSWDRTREVWMRRWAVEDTLKPAPSITLDGRWMWLGAISTASTFKIDEVQTLEVALKTNSLMASITDERLRYFDEMGNERTRAALYGVGRFLVRAAPDASFTQAVRGIVLSWRNNLYRALVFVPKAEQAFIPLVRDGACEHWNLEREGFGTRDFPILRQPALIGPDYISRLVGFGMTKGPDETQPDSMDADASREDLPPGEQENVNANNAVDVQAGGQGNEHGGGGVQHGHQQAGSGSSSAHGVQASQMSAVGGHSGVGAGGPMGSMSGVGGQASASAPGGVAGGEA